MLALVPVVVHSATPDAGSIGALGAVAAFPFIYRLYECVMLYGPVFKDVAHELFGDGIMSAIDMSVDIRKVEEGGVKRMVLTLNGKWLEYKKF